MEKDAFVVGLHGLVRISVRQDFGWCASPSFRKVAAVKSQQSHLRYGLCAQWQTWRCIQFPIEPCNKYGRYHNILAMYLRQGDYKLVSHSLDTSCMLFQNLSRPSLSLRSDCRHPSRRHHRRYCLCLLPIYNKKNKSAEPLSPAPIVYSIFKYYLKSF